MSEVEITRPDPASSTSQDIKLLLGQITYEYLLEVIADGVDPEAPDGYIIMSNYSPAVVAGMAAAATKHHDHPDFLKLMLNRNDMSPFDVDANHLCEENAVAVRNMPTDGYLLVVAEFERDKQSLSAACSLDSQEMEEPARAHIWVKSITHSLGITFVSEEQYSEAEALTKGLLQTYSPSSESAARYLSAVFHIAVDQGVTLAIAAGRALPLLGLPLFENCFAKIPTTQPSKWRDRLRRHWRNESYLSKRDTNRNLLDTEELRDRLKDFHAKNEAGETAVSDDLLVAFEHYIDSDTAKTEATEHLLYSFDWTDVYPLLEKARTTKTQSLGKATLAHFEVLNETLEDYEIVLLKSIDKRKPKHGDTSDALREFFAKYSELISEDPRLLKRWEEVIHGKDILCTDLFDGLIRCVRKMAVFDDAYTGQDLNIKLIGRRQTRPLSFVAKNQRACEFFEHQYRSISPYLDGRVTLHDTVICQYTDDVLPKIRDRKDFRGNSAAKIARELEFEVRLLAQGSSGEQEVATCKLIWQFEHRSVLARMRDDLRRLTDNVSRTALVQCTAEREAVGSKGTPQPLSLEDASGFHEGASGRGAFVPAKSKCVSPATTWRETLTSSVETTEIDSVLASSYRDAFDSFEATYNQCISVLADDQLSFAGVEAVVAEYGVLLEALATVPDESTRRRLLRPILMIGTVMVPGSLGEGPAAVICPWHPLRLQAIESRCTQLRDALLSQLSADRIGFSDKTGDIFYSDIEQLVTYPLRPELAVAWTGDAGSSPREMSVMQAYGGYSLHEYPFQEDGFNNAIHDDPRAGSRIIKRLVEEYLRLQPHERSNLSIALYNSDSATLPLTVVNEINKLNGDDNNITCQVILTHNDGVRLRDTYKRLVGRTVNPDELLGTEATGEFLSRVRINILATSQIEQPGRCPAVDIALCQDVVSRNASPDWWRIPRIIFPSNELQPHQWSRRQPVATNDDVCRLYLCCPCQTSEGWQYLFAISSVFSNEAIHAWNAGECRILTRRIDFSQHNLGTIFRDTHRVAAWVVNHDELLDRRLLEAQGVSVIRYEQATTHGRNLVVSSKASDTFLRASLRDRMIDIFGEDLPRDDIEKLCDKMLSDAATLSGGLVLKAARRSRNTNELIGCVLSQFLLSSQLGQVGKNSAWSLLDDYAKWLGKSPGSNIADILCLAPITDLPTGKHLEILVSEAKFIQYPSLPESKRKSARQLRDTLAQIETALTSPDAPADQGIWLARISDLLGINLRSYRSPVLEDWKASIRRGACSIRVRGYSHVFCYGPKNELAVESESTGIRDCRQGYQEVFSHQRVQECLLAYLHSDGTKATSIRHSVGQIDLTDIASDEERRLPRSPQHDDTPIVAEPDSQNDAHPQEEIPAPDEQPAAVDSVPESPPADEQPATIEPDPVVPAHELVEDPAKPQHEGTTSVSPPKDIRDFLNTQCASYRASSTHSDEWLDQIGNDLRAAFIRRQLPCKIISQILTPNAAVFKLQGSQNLTVTKIEGNSGEIKTSEAIDIIAVRPEMGQISLSVRRPNREILHSECMFARYLEELASGLNPTHIPVAINEDDGSIIYLKPFEVPHSLVAGETGSGKSVLMCNVIAAISLAQSPSESEIILVDPKQGNDYQAILDLPHLRHIDGQPIVTEPDQLIRVVDTAISEMKSRNKMFLQARANNLQSYREKTGEDLPMLWLVYDEFGVWMQDAEFKRELMPKINHLAKQSRSAGIFLILADQRPDNTVFPLQTRDNLGNRFVLSVNSIGTSEIALGEKGAEHLLKHGHMLAKTADYPRPQYAQVPFISPDDMAYVVSLIRQQGAGDA